MKKRDFVTVILIIVIILLVALVGLFGYAMYRKIMGREDIISFDGDEETSIGGNSDDDTTGASSDVVLSGVGGNTTNSDNERSRNLYNQLSDTAKTIYDGLYQNRENLKTGTYRIEFGESFESILSKDGGEDELKREYQSAIEAFLYDNPENFLLRSNKYVYKY